MEIDTSFCILCDGVKKDALVKSPNSSSIKLLYNAIIQQASYGNQKYCRLLSLLNIDSADEFSSLGVSWHSSCYKNATHINARDNARKSYEKRITLAGGETPCGSQDTETVRLTRSITTPHKKEICFFCDEPGSDQDKLMRLEKTCTMDEFKQSVRLSQNAKWLVKLSSAIDSEDVAAMDTCYHRGCWLTNVVNFLKKHKRSVTSSHNLCASEVAAEIEFECVIRYHREIGTILNTSDVQSIYQNIRNEFNLQNPDISRKAVKSLLQSKFTDIEFHTPKQKNKPQFISFKDTRDDAVDNFEKEKSIPKEMKHVYEAASVLRKSILNAEKWTFEGKFDDITEEHIPQVLTTFFRWLVAGPKTTINKESKMKDVTKRVNHLAQMTISSIYTDRQVRNKKSNNFSSHRSYMPQQVANGIIMRQKYRDKQGVKFLSQSGDSVPPSWLLVLEHRIANTELENFIKNDSFYVPVDFVKERFIFFATDNCDFKEDTLSGKDTSHVTAVSIYQRKQPGDVCSDIKLSPESKCQKLAFETIIPIKKCTMPKSPKPPQPTYPNANLFDNTTPHCITDDLLLFICKAIIRNRLDTQLGLLTVEDILEFSGVDAENEIDILIEERPCKIPPWSAFNSLTTDIMPTTRIATLPLINAPAHEFSTLLTVLMQAQDINTKIVGPNRKTVISMDLGLYLPAKQLQMSRSDLDQIILRVGELHVVKAQLKTIGAYIDGSGISTCWDESGVFGSATSASILDGGHINRGMDAHLMTIQSLIALYNETFFDLNKDLYRFVANTAETINEASDAMDVDVLRSISESMQQSDFIDIYQIIYLFARMRVFDELHKDIPMFVFLKNYMHMVFLMLAFVRSVRTGDWKLHLESLTAFIKYFFAHDKRNYARLIPVYLSEMQMLKETSPDIQDEFDKGNWVINKNESVSFCGIGADHALEHINRSMKVSGGLIGITMNISARNRFFLISPCMARLAEEAKRINGTEQKNGIIRHHKLQPHVLKKLEDRVSSLTETMKGHDNPFKTESNKLFNLVTKKVLPQVNQEEICQQPQIGQALCEKFCTERILSKEVNLWATLSQRNLLTWRANMKKLKVKTRLEGNIVELSADRALFGRMIIAGRSRPEVDLLETIGTYELSVVPRSLFALDGSMHHVSKKSELMDILSEVCEVESIVNEQFSAIFQEVLKSFIPEYIEELSADATENTQLSETVDFSRMPVEDTYKIAIIDGMAEVQVLEKPEGISTCSQLGDFFSTEILRKYNTYDELHVIFDRYDLELSLKQASKGTVPIHYHITDTTDIQKLSMKALLSHVNTKKELSEYFARKLLKIKGKNVVVAFSDKCISNVEDMSYLSSTQEEADTKMFLHAVYCSKHYNFSMNIDIFSPDTDVLVLTIHRYPMLCANTRFINRGKIFDIKLIVDGLGPEKCNGLPGFHAFSGADVTGSFYKKGKKTCWKIYNEGDPDILKAFGSLGTTVDVHEDAIRGLEKFVCKIFHPKTKLFETSELRKWLFRKEQSQSERLPPTKAALLQSILRSHYQNLVWKSDIVANPTLPPAEKYGWVKLNDKYEEVMTTSPPAPDAILNIIKCNCQNSSCSNLLCSCKKAGLNCTDMCGCSLIDDLECKNCVTGDTVEGADNENDDSDAECSDNEV